MRTKDNETPNISYSFREAWGASRSNPPEKIGLVANNAKYLSDSRLIDGLSPFANEVTQ